MGRILWAAIVILFAFWLTGFVLHFGGGLIHLLLLVALVLIIVRGGSGKLDGRLSGVLAHLQSEYALRSEQEYAQTPTA